MVWFQSKNIAKKVVLAIKFYFDKHLHKLLRYYVEILSATCSNFCTLLKLITSAKNRMHLLVCWVYK